ncbi:MAG TPA: hypothetical protein PLN60_10335 [Bacillota bacterium]|nr:hypothetical protein [Bacillota bacterium]
MTWTCEVHHRLADVVAVGVVFSRPGGGEECDLFRGRAEDEEEA